MPGLDVPCPAFFFLPGCGIHYCTNVTDMSCHVTIPSMKTSHRPNIIEGTPVWLKLTYH